MSVAIAGFDWDDSNWPKCAKHGVSKAEIEHVLMHVQLLSQIVARRRKSASTLSAEMPRAAYLFIVFAFRVKDEDALIRLISARYMH